MQGFFIIVLIVTVGPIVLHSYTFFKRWRWPIAIGDFVFSVLSPRKSRQTSVLPRQLTSPQLSGSILFVWEVFSYNLLDHDRRSGDPIIHFSWTVNKLLMFHIQVNSATSQWDYRMAVSETLKWQHPLNGTNTTRPSWGGSIAHATGSTWVPGAREVTTGISTYRWTLKGQSR